jgi:hypothetical protein
LDAPIIYLGPTMPVSEAREILPGHYLPPVACGDILRIRPLRPRAILLIDGVFESVGSVWHKELMLAMQDGVHVLGCSSMGALRAAELEHFGMVGIGTIFERYRDRRYTDDDEVAVLHTARESGWRSLTIPLVNVRATVERAVAERVLSTTEAAVIVEACRGVFYQERTLEAIWAQLSGSVDAGCIRRFRQFVDAGGYVDQKRLDAVAMLEAFALGGARWVGRGARSATPWVHRNNHVRRIETEIMCRPFRHRPAWLPRLEQLALDARLLGPTYLLLRMFAELLMIADTVARVRGIEPAADHRDAVEDIPAARWMDDGDRAAFVARAARLRALLSQDLPPAARSVEAFEHDLHGLFGLQVEGRSGRSLSAKVAGVWRVVDEAFLAAGMDVNDERLAHVVKEFRVEHGLLTRAQTLDWMRGRGLSERAFADMMGAFARYTTALDCNWCNHLGGQDTTDGVAWLIDALALAGMHEAPSFPPAAELGAEAAGMPLRDLVEHHCAAIGVTAPEDLEAFASELDFHGGEQELLRELGRLYAPAQRSDADLS